MEALPILIFIVGPPLATLLVSVIYFRAAEHYSPGTRLLVSLHGVALTCWFIVAICMNVLGFTGAKFQFVFYAALFIPSALALYSIFRFEGGAIHLLQIVNLVCALAMMVLAPLIVRGL
jgi:predicted membrane-bound dolichyl-phosphate-mannose-protein mannosyltransferase